MRRAITVLSVSFVAVFAVSALSIGTASASAAVLCGKVVAGEPSKWEAGCTKAGTGYAKIETAGATRIGKKEWCVKVAAGETGKWATNACSKGVTGTTWIAITSAVPILVIKGTAETTGVSHAVETKIKSTNKKFVLKGEIGTEPVTLEGTEVKSTKAFVKGTEPATDGAEELEFTGVKVTSPSTCTGDTVTSRKESGATKTASGVVVTKEVSTEFLEGGTSGVLDKFTPTSGTVFVEIELTKAGSCPISTSYYKATGTENGEELEPEVEAEWKTLDFPAEGSKLEFDGKTASLEGEAEERLTTKEVWTVFP